MRYYFLNKNIYLKVISLYNIIESNKSLDGLCEVVAYTNDTSRYNDKLVLLVFYLNNGQHIHIIATAVVGNNDYISHLYNILYLIRFVERVEFDILQLLAIAIQAIVIDIGLQVWLESWFQCIKSIAKEKMVKSMHGE